MTSKTCIGVSFQSGRRVRGTSPSKQSAPRAQGDNLGFVQRPGSNFASGSGAPTREPASTRPVDRNTLTSGPTHFHPLRARHRLMINFAVKNLIGKSYGSGPRVEGFLGERE